MRHIPQRWCSNNCCRKKWNKSCYICDRTKYRKIGSKRFNRCSIISQQSRALITQTVLESIKPEAQKYLDAELSAVIGRKQYAPTLEDKFSFLAVQIRDGSPVISPNNEAIKAYITTIDTDTSYAPKSDIYYSTGELLSEGVDGRSIDRETASYQLSQAFGSHDSSKITLATTIVPRTKNH